MASCARALFAPLPIPLAVPLAMAYFIVAQHGRQQAGGGWQAGATGAPLEYDDALGALSTPLQIAKWPFERNWAHLTEGCEGDDCGVEKILLEVGANRRDVLQVPRFHPIPGTFQFTFFPGSGLSFGSPALLGRMSIQGGWRPARRSY